jgi:hypothetical protein
MKQAGKGYMNEYGDSGRMPGKRLPTGGGAGPD